MVRGWEKRKHPAGLESAGGVSSWGAVKLASDCEAGSTAVAVLLAARPAIGRYVRSHDRYAAATCTAAHHPSQIGSFERAQADRPAGH